MSKTTIAITNETEYAAALAEIEGLWKSPPGSHEGDRLGVLLDAVGKYEEAHHPIPQPSPEALAEFIREQKSEEA